MSIRQAKTKKYVVLWMSVPVLLGACSSGATESASTTTGTIEVTTTTTTTTTSTLPPTTTTTIPTKSVTGSILVWDETPTKVGLVAGKSCEGVDISYEYFDMRSSLPVYVNDIAGDVIKRTELDTGFVSKGGQGCCFTFTVKLQKGSDKNNGFVFQLGKSSDRGDSRITWDQIEEVNAGLRLALSLGIESDGDVGILATPAGMALLECAAKGRSGHV